MEGKCYALVWGVMHFHQYFYHNHFTLMTNHKPLEWLAIIFNVYGRRGKWINTLHDFSLKIVHRTMSQHTNMNVLSHNLVDATDEDLGDDTRRKLCIFD
jgi:hypothetical protein